MRASSWVAPSSENLAVFRPVNITHRLLSSSFLGLPCRILNRSHKKELLRSLWVKLSRVCVLRGEVDPGDDSPLSQGQLQLLHLHT